MALRYRYRKTDGWLGILLVLIAAFLGASQQTGLLDKLGTTAVKNQPGLYQVTQFVDGDTITVNMNGSGEKVRMIGVDTPETHKPNSPVQCYGPAASAYTKNVIGLQKVRLVSDSRSGDRDRYKRLLRYVYLEDGRLLNKLIIESGHGFYYPYFPFDKSAEFNAAQQQARAGYKGLWGNCQPTPTDRGGWVSNNL